MTSPFDSSSPSNNIPQPSSVSAPKELSIHTMRGDLEALRQKKAAALQPPPIPISEKPDPLKKLTPPEQIKPSFNGGSAADGTKANSTAYKITLSVVVVLIMGIVGLGGYYFLVSRQAKPIPQPVVKTPAPVEPAPSITQPTEKYSQEKPNYLSLDLLSLSADEIKTSISAVATELKTKNSTTPYEFVVVDSNNNPIAFSVFATAAKLNLSPIILTSLGENFSLFMFNDTDNERLTLTVDAKDKTLLTTELQKQEKTLITDLSFLFLDAKPEITKGLFKTSVYNNVSIRYFNLNPQITLSVDYAFVNNQLIISTSKKTIRAIIDKITAPDTKKVVQAPTPPVQTPNPSEAAKQTVGTCADLPDKLSSCTPYVCSIPNIMTNGEIQKQITGIVDGKCNYTEQLANNGKLECNYTDVLRKRVADSIKTTYSSGNFSATGNVAIIAGTAAASGAADGQSFSAEDIAQCAVVAGNGV